MGIFYVTKKGQVENNFFLEIVVAANGQTNLKRVFFCEGQENKRELQDLGEFVLRHVQVEKPDYPRPDEDGAL